MKRFLIVWLGQFVSMIGSGLTTFALAVWVYQQTGSASRWTFVLLAAMLPMVLLSPIAGVAIDRIGQRRALILSSAGGALGPLIVGLLVIFGKLHLWHIYGAVALGGVFTALQWPAYTSAVSLLVAKNDYTRANGLVQFAQGTAFIASPLLGAIWIAHLGLEGIFFADFASFVAAIVALLIVPMARPERGPEAQQLQLSYGLRYIIARPGLLGLLTFYAVANFVYGLGYSLLPPLLLSHFPASTLGNVQAMMGGGGLLAGLLMAVWRGPQRRINAVIICELVLSIGIAMAGIQPSLGWITTGGCLAAFSLTIVMVCSQAIWQSKVDPACQGRVFAVRYMIAWSTLPLAYAAAGPLAEYAFRGGMGILARTAPLTAGDGQVEGIRLVLVAGAALNVMAAICAYIYPRVRLVESELPDAMATSVEELVAEAG